MENIPKHFRWELENVQQRVPGTFELDDRPLVLSGLLLHSLYGLAVGLVTQSVIQQVKR